MRMTFNDWERIEPEEREHKGGRRHNHKITFWRNSINSKRGDRLMINISKDLLDECGRRKFSLYKKGGMYAFVPNNFGEYEKSAKYSYVKGVTHKMVEEILTNLGYDKDVRKLSVDAVCMDGVIYFPCVKGGLSDE